MPSPFPWDVEVSAGRRKVVAAWCFWVLLMLGYLGACTVAIVKAIELRRHPFITTYVDRGQKVLLPDVQVCIVDQTDYTGEIVSSFGRNASLEVVPYDLSILKLAAGGDEVSWLPECPPQFATDINRPYPGDPWPEVFSYTEKRMHGVSLVDGDDSPGNPYLYSNVRNERLNFSGVMLDPQYSLGPTKARNESTTGGEDNTKVVVGVDPRFACLTFYLSLCAPQAQENISSSLPAFVMELNGTGPPFSSFIVSVGQAPLQNPLFQAASEPAGQRDFTLFAAPNSSSVSFSYVQTESEQLQSPFTGPFWYQKKEVRAFEKLSYTLGSILPESTPGTDFRDSNQSIVPFKLRLVMYISPQGVVHLKEQEPFLALIAFIGGLWSFVPLLFGLIYVPLDPIRLRLHPNLDCCYPGSNPSSKNKTPIRIAEGDTLIDVDTNGKAAEK
ncbi:hypothetical protein KFL_000240410 [Klebsormidium nitens]|uniref:Uncharacterized protein n=1 Tax=Klebsormidium nitens TaxID=105231 RepID=A0A1Y1HPH9_KLENI|nr:hypothetical protein KFL_000240410 [Klebsormidium nitens]|eukprot:GAQ79109.1 hypothetical protein KFL_000240410 [Klebsormidium nitens]